MMNAELYLDGQLLAETTCPESARFDTNDIEPDHSQFIIYFNNEEEGTYATENTVRQYFNI